MRSKDALEWDAVLAEEIIAPNGTKWDATSIFAFVLVYFAIHLYAVRMGKRVGPPLSIRPTIVGSTVHGTTTVIASLLVLGLGPEYYWIWQKVALPSSIGYFISDLITYCVPKKDALIAFHHFAVICGHYPVGETLGAWCGGAGNAEWATWLSMMGYTSEFSVPLLSARWWAVQTLTEHKTWFAVLGVSIVLSFALRCVLMSYLLLFEIFPRWVRFYHHNQLTYFMVGCFGHLAIGLLSLYWLQTLLRGGWSSYMTFQQKPKDSEFSFRSSFVANPKKNGKKKAT